MDGNGYCPLFIIGTRRQNNLPKIGAGVNASIQYHHGLNVKTVEFNEELVFPGAGEGR